MTLIVELHDTIRRQSAFISDCLVSRSDDYSLKTNNFPVHQGSGWNIDTRGVGIVSKCVLEDSRFMLSAGNFESIKNLAYEFERVKSLKKFQSFVASYYSERLRTESFLCGGEVDGHTMSTDWNCTHFSCGHVEVICGGSGANYVRGIFEHSKPKTELSIRRLAFEFLALLLRLEFVDYDFPKHSFGGAYEVFMRSGTSYQRLPYCVIDFTCEARVAADGIREIDKLTLARTIFYVPINQGALFMNSLRSHSPPRLLVTLIKEVNSSYLSKYDQNEVLEIMDAFNPIFTIILIRHEDVNYVLSPENFVRVDASSNPYYLEVDMKSISDLIKDWFGQNER